MRYGQSSIDDFKVQHPGCVSDRSGRPGSIALVLELHARGQVSVPGERCGADWFRGNHSANVFLRYTHSYNLGRTPSALIAALNNRTPTDQIDEFLTVDVQYSYQFSELFGMPGPTVTFGAINLFNEYPPTIDDGPGFDSKMHDPRGRIAYGRIMVQF